MDYIVVYCIAEENRFLSIRLDEYWGWSSGSLAYLLYKPDLTSEPPDVQFLNVLTV
jgi:hypothetical protein